MSNRGRAPCIVARSRWRIGQLRGSLNVVAANESMLSEGAVSGLSGAGLTNGVAGPYLGAHSEFAPTAPPTGEVQKS
jgi:hypothetical protein